MSTGRRTIVAAAVALAALAVSACSDGGGGDAADTLAPATLEPSDPAIGAAGTEPPTTAEQGAATTAGTTPTPATEPTAATDVATTIGTVPDDGVPGIESGDVFCRSWSEFAGSFQALAVAYAFGADPTEPPRLEVAAAPVLIDAVDGLATGLPDELESEREALTSELVGPMLRRAGRAVSALRAAGLSDAAIAELGDAWLATLAESGLDHPDLSIAVPADERFAGFEPAREAFAAAVPPINQDPSLITDAQIPLTEQYLRENCPDQGVLGGNDIIDEL